MNEFHKFLDRNYILYFSCINSELNSEDISILNSKGYLKQNDSGLSMLSSQPNWLKKWTSLIC